MQMTVLAMSLRDVAMQQLTTSVPVYAERLECGDEASSATAFV
jgi:hypothetical protein